MRKVMTIGIVVMVALLLGGNVSAQDEIILSPDEIMWKAGPASLPPGSEVVVLEGEPGSPGIVTIRLKMPPNSMISPHTHGSDERVTVLSGTLFFATGEMMDKAKARALTAGSYFVIPKGKAMYGYAGDEGVVLQLTVEGPWTMSPVENKGGYMK